jgi:hypothetical protein
VLQIRQADECDIRDLVDLDDECFDTCCHSACVVNLLQPVMSFTKMFANPIASKTFKENFKGSQKAGYGTFIRRYFAYITEIITIVPISRFLDR